MLFVVNRMNIGNLLVVPIDRKRAAVEVSSQTSSVIQLKDIFFLFILILMVLVALVLVESLIAFLIVAFLLVGEGEAVHRDHEQCYEQNLLLHI